MPKTRAPLVTFRSGDGLLAAHDRDIAASLVQRHAPSVDSSVFGRVGKDSNGLLSQIVAAFPALEGEARRSLGTALRVESVRSVLTTDPQLHRDIGITFEVTQCLMKRDYKAASDFNFSLSDTDSLESLIQGIMRYDQTPLGGIMDNPDITNGALNIHPTLGRIHRLHADCKAIVAVENNPIQLFIYDSTKGIGLRGRPTTPLMAPSVRHRTQYLLSRQVGLLRDADLRAVAGAKCKRLPPPLRAP